MWDCEIYALPFLTFTWPEAARRMLMYRHATLGEARAKAARLGFAGALYAWESAATGAEVTPRYATTRDGERTPIRTGDAAHHVSADVAYAVWQYWCATGDEAFLRDAGAEILVETARFWANRAALGRDGRYHVRGVVGPDEYHDDVDDDAYTTSWRARTSRLRRERSRGSRGAAARARPARRCAAPSSRAGGTSSSASASPCATA